MTKDASLNESILRFDALRVNHKCYSNSQMVEMLSELLERFIPTDEVSVDRARLECK